MTSRILLVCIPIAMLSMVPSGNWATCSEKIEGAFGITLGQTFEPGSAIGSGNLTDGTPMYQFQPEKPFDTFSRYYVMITPITHKVYSIWGIGTIENDPVCKKEQAVVVELLRKKYGTPKKKGLMETMFDAELISQGNRQIIVKCTGFMDVTIEARYYDEKLKKIAEQERLKTETQKKNASGL